MALLTANKLGIYVLDYLDADIGFRQTTPLSVVVNDTSLNAGIASYTSGTPASGAFFVVNSGDTWYGNGGAPEVPALYHYNSAGPTTTEISDDLRVSFAATNSSLDFSTAVDEVVAKGTQCKSNTYTSIGSNSWSITVDGLISNESTEGGDVKGTSIFDICNRGEYVVVKYMLDSTDNDGADESNAVYIGQGIVESANISGSFDSTQTYSATIRGYGKLYKYLH